MTALARSGYSAARSALHLMSGASADDMLALQVFPVAREGKPNFGPTFGAPRDGGLRMHEGVDIFATEGTSVFAVVDGRARADTNQLGGNVVHLTAPDGTWYYYAHLSAYEPAAGGARPVRAGDVIGYVGRTGNARNSPPHLHFEIHPGGGPAVDPFEALRAVAPDGSFHKDAPGAGNASTSSARAGTKNMPGLGTFVLVGLGVGLGVAAMRGKRS